MKNSQKSILRKQVQYKNQGLVIATFRDFVGRLEREPVESAKNEKLPPFERDHRRT